MTTFKHRAVITTCLAIALLLGAAGSTLAADEPAPQEPVKFRVTGLFIPERVDDFQTLMRDYPDVKLVGVDYDTAEASFRFDPKTAFPGTKPTQIAERFDQLLRQKTRGSFGIRPLCEVPREKLKFVEIPILGLDCKACSFGAYDAICRLDGVERATASFHDGRVTAWIDPDKTDRATLEAALVKRRVTLKQP
jgi:hypothetical protein